MNAQGTSPTLKSRKECDRIERAGQTEGFVRSGSRCSLQVIFSTGTVMWIQFTTLPLNKQPMNATVRNILAVILGWIGGSAVNMTLVNLGHRIFPIAGVDPTDMDALAQVLPNLDVKYFLFPFLAHALGTLAGAIIASWLAVRHKAKFALGVGFLFLIGGIAVNVMLPGPTWFAVIDILLAYLPMGWLGGKIGTALSAKQPNTKP